MKDFIPKRKKKQEFKVKYNMAKTKNTIIQEFMGKHVNDKTHERVVNCAVWMEYFADLGDDNCRISRCPFCKWRFCPMCAMRASYRDAMKIGMMVDWIADEHGLDFLFTTCSARNVKGEDLPKEITRYSNAHNKMLKRKDVMAINKGCIRKLEITYNAEETITYDMWHGKGRYKGKPMEDYFITRGLRIGDPNPNYDTYHTHLHVLWAVDKHYFKSRKYLNREKWLKLWQEVMKDDSITHMHVQRLKRGGENKEIQEIAKYAAKPDDYTHSQEVFDMFYKAIKGRKALTYNGLFRDGSKIHKEYKKAKLKHEPHIWDKYALVDTAEYVYMVKASWFGKEYAETARRELTNEEINAFFGQAEDDFELED